jgi:6-phosphogluconolactonase
LYAVNEISGFEGGSTGAVSAFQIDPKSGDLIFLNRVPSGGKGPCFITIDSRGQFALVANYGGGSVSSIEIQSDGYLGKTISNLHHHGSSIHPRRQNRPHAHSILLDSSEQFAFAADLGTDQVWIYLFERNIGRLRPHEPSHLKLPPGSGPRHLAFHPTLPIIYVINELTSRVAVIRHHNYEEFSQLQLIPTLPDNVKSKNYPAEILVHPSGQFLYASNRGHDSIAGFKINPGNGKLTPVSLTFSGGNVPRNFNFDPTGKYLLVANQRSSNIVLFEINRVSGKLRNTKRSIRVPEPVCIRFWAATDNR